MNRRFSLGGHEDVHNVGVLVLHHLHVSGQGSEGLFVLLGAVADVEGEEGLRDGGDGVD
jgi:hypothetical protein